MNRSSLLLIIFAACLLLSLDATGVAQAPKQNGKFINNVRAPKTAHVQNALNEGKVKRIRGKLYCCKEGIPYGAIVSLYVVLDEREHFVYSYLVGADGKFDFKGLKKGTYVLKTGTTDGYFNSLNVTVILAPGDKDSKSDDLEIPLEIGT